MARKEKERTLHNACRSFSWLRKVMWDHPFKTQFKFENKSQRRCWFIYYCRKCDCEFGVIDVLDLNPNSKLPKTIYNVKALYDKKWIENWKTRRHIP